MDNVIKCIGCVLIGLCIGFGIGYMAQPDPKVEIRAILKPPFVEVRINGKVYDANHLKLVPEPAPKKGWWENPPKAISMNCQCGENCNCTECKCGEKLPVLLTSLQTEQRDNRGGNQNDLLFGGIKDIIKDFMNWLAGRGDEVARAYQERERTISQTLGWVGVAVATGFLMMVIPLWSIAVSQAKLAGKA